ncbi:hypothetical protein [Ktedonobacter robiniae]|uniref:hypothetical protein n=1 Tax=Ktedonobacter robiniae TaxID=2778365 RepID=UPI003B75C58A
MLHMGLRAQELCTLTRQQIHLSKRNGTLRILGKRKKFERFRSIPLLAWPYISIWRCFHEKNSISSIREDIPRAYRTSTGTFSDEICHSVSSF